MGTWETERKLKCLFSKKKTDVCLKKGKWGWKMGVKYILFLFSVFWTFWNFLCDTNIFGQLSRLEIIFKLKTFFGKESH